MQRKERPKIRILLKKLIGICNFMFVTGGELRWSSWSRMLSTGTQGAFLPVRIFSKPRGFPVLPYSIEEREALAREFVEGRPPSCHVPGSVKSSLSTPRACPCVSQRSVPRDLAHCCALQAAHGIGAQLSQGCPAPAPASCFRFKPLRKLG